MSMIDSVTELEALATGIAIIDGDNVITYANTTFARRLNIEVLPRRLTDITLPEARSRDLLEWQLRDIGESALTIEIAPGRTLTFYIGARRDDQRMVIVASGWPRREESTLDLAAQLDPLTGFGNRLMYACLVGLSMRKEGMTDTNYYSPLSSEHGQDDYYGESWRDAR